MLRVRFAPSPTGYLHIGSARTFIFNWLYARRNHGTMILRIDDTDVERNTQASLDSIFEGLKWLDLGWDELYRQSERGELHRAMANEILEKGLAYRDFTPAADERRRRNRIRAGPWLFNPGMRELSQRGKRPAGGGGRAVRAAFPRAARDAGGSLRSTICVYGRAIEGDSGYRGFRAAAQHRRADLSHGVLRRRCGSADQPHHSRPGSPDEYVQARADFRGAGGRAAASSRICRC